MDCVEKLIGGDGVDPINGKPIREGDIIELQRGGALPCDQVDYFAEHFCRDNVEVGCEAQRQNKSTRLEVLSSHSLKQELCQIVERYMDLTLVANGRTDYSVSAFY